MQIYVIKNLITNKVYVGKSRNYLKRFNSHKAKARRKLNRYLYDSINHHGINNFTVSLIEECDEVMADEREIFWIIEKNLKMQ